MKKYVSPEMISFAKNRDLAEFLISKGEPLKKTGNRYKHIEHDSLVFTKNLYYWNSRQEKGNSLDFVMSYYNMNFTDAVEFLSETTFLRENNDRFQNKSKMLNKELTEEKKEEKEFSYDSADNINRAIAYLSKTRKIFYDDIKFFASQHLISQDKNGNVVFKIFDENNKLVGAELAGTLTDKRFKGICPNSKVGYGFNLHIGNDKKNPKFTIFFESPIDLISFYCLYKEKLNSHRLISLGGLRKDILENSIRKFNIDVKSVFLAVDNDDAGKNFIKDIQKEFFDIKSYIPCSPYKDWNDVLKSNSINDWQKKINIKKENSTQDKKSKKTIREKNDVQIE